MIHKLQGLLVVFKSFSPEKEFVHLAITHNVSHKEEDSHNQTSMQMQNGEFERFYVHYLL